MVKDRLVRDKAVAQIYETDNLDKFKFVAGNREVGSNRALKASIKEKGIIEPITVNKNFEVTDGQHRLTIARELNIPIRYKYSEKSTDSVMDMNNTQKAWRLTDYIHSYSAQGNKDYIRLTQLLDKYPALRASKTSQQAIGATQGHTRGTSHVKNGNFAFQNYPEFVKFAKSFQKFIDKTGMQPNSAVQEAYFMLYALAPFDADRFTKKVIARNLVELLAGVTGVYRVTKSFVEANNSGLKTKSKNWISLTTDELGVSHFNNAFNDKLMDTAPSFVTK